MFCFVDFRNRPQYKYTFSSLEKAKEYLRKIQNNPLGATILHADGRREYFSSGVPENLINLQDIQIKKGCHVKYKIRPLAVLDGIAPNAKKEKGTNILNWKSRKTSSLFMIGNLKFSACLLTISLFAFTSTFFLQQNLGQLNFSDRSVGHPVVLGASDSQIENSDGNGDISLQLGDEDVIMSLIGKIDDERHDDFKQEILHYIKGKPMEDMAPYIAKQPRTVAAFIVGIAMKESKFGVYAPHDANGNDCHNYWGYRGPENTTASGYSCFTSPEHAVQVVGKKINKLVAQGISNPTEMISWKCGSTCAGHGTENVRKWIADVGVNFYRINSAKENS
jgi:hypothetical protein